VISSAVSFVDLVLVEVAAGFFLPRDVEFAPALGLTERETAGLRARFVLPLFGSLARQSKIDRVSHAVSRR
jgi:hypothetical protein